MSNLNEIVDMFWGNNEKREDFKMRNFTPHQINIIDVNSVMFDPKIRKYVPDNREYLWCAPCNREWLWEPGNPSSQYCPTCGNIHTYAGQENDSIKHKPVTLVSIPSSGMLSAQFETVSSKPINGIPVFIKKVTGCDQLPDGDDPLIVSAIYAVAARQMGYPMERLYVVSDPVVTPDGNQILGCIGVGPAV